MPFCVIYVEKPKKYLLFKKSLRIMLLYISVKIYLLRKLLWKFWRNELSLPSSYKKVYF